MRAGSKLYKNIEIPYNAKIIVDKQQRECYPIGINGNDVYIKYIDTQKIITVNYELIKDKL